MKRMAWEVPRSMSSHPGLFSTGCCVSRGSSSSFGELGRHVNDAGGEPRKLGQAGLDLDRQLTLMVFTAGPLLAGATVCAPFPLATRLFLVFNRSRLNTVLGPAQDFLNAFRVRGPSPQTKIRPSASGGECAGGGAGPAGPRALGLRGHVGRPKLPGPGTSPVSNTLVLQPL